MIKVENLSILYRVNGREFPGLKNFSGEFMEGEIGVIFGPSGSGKTSLLLSIGTLLEPAEGRVLYDGVDVYSLPEKKVRELRKNLGISFQEPTFVNVLSVWENIELGLYASGRLNEEFKKRARELAETLGIAQILNKKPSEISGGEARRAAIVRALAHDPQTILLDEPTAYLDAGSAEKLVEILQEERERGKILILTTHDPVLEKVADRRFKLQYGMSIGPDT